MDSAFLSRIRIIIIAFCVFFAYAVILIRLWAVQVYKGEEIQEKVSRQYVRNIRIPAVRGRIFTADGVMLAGNTSTSPKCAGPENEAAPSVMSSMRQTALPRQSDAPPCLPKKTSTAT